MKKESETLEDRINREFEKTELFKTIKKAHENNESEGYLSALNTKRADELYKIRKRLLEDENPTDDIWI